MAIRVIVVDDDEWIRAHFATLANEDASIKLIAQAATAKDGLERIKALKPEVAIIDITLRDSAMGGLQLCSILKKECPETDIVILTGHEDEAYFNEAMDIEISGYVLKDKIDDLLEAVKQVHKGVTYIAPKFQKYLLDRYRKRARFEKENPEIKQLTRKELEVLIELAENKSSKEIGDELFIAEKTVDNHRENARKKLGLKGKNALLVWALKNKHLIHQLLQRK